MVTINAGGIYSDDDDDDDYYDIDDCDDYAEDDCNYNDDVLITKTWNVQVIIISMMIKTKRS